MSRHRDFFAHHVREREDSAIRVDFEELFDDFCVRGLVSFFVGRDCAADLCEFYVAVLFRVARSVAVRDEGRAFLEGRVDEPEVGAVFGTRILCTKFFENLQMSRTFQN